MDLKKVQKHNVYLWLILWSRSIFPHIYVITRLFFLPFLFIQREREKGIQIGGGKAVQYYYHFLFLWSQGSSGSELRGVLAASRLRWAKTYCGMGRKIMKPACRETTFK